MRAKTKANAALSPFLRDLEIEGSLRTIAAPDTALALQAEVDES